MKYFEHFRVDLVLLSVVLIWGMNFAVVKLIYRFFEPLAFNALRFGVTTLTMWLILRFRRTPAAPERKDRTPILVLGIVSTTVYQFCFILGLAGTRAGNGGLLMALTPIFTYLIGLALGHERFQRGILGGILVSTFGVAIVVLYGAGEVGFGSTWKGDLLLLGAAFCWGYYSASSQPLIIKYGALRVTVWSIAAGTLFLLPLSLPWIVRQDWRAIPWHAWAAFCYSTFLAIVYCYFAWTYALRRIGMSRTAVYSNLTPLIALGGAWALLGEIPTAGQMAGVLFVLSGILIVRTRKALPDPATGR